jgi:hypothetical protein
MACSALANLVGALSLVLLRSLPGRLLGSLLGRLLGRLLGSLLGSLLESLLGSLLESLLEIQAKSHKLCSAVQSCAIEKQASQITAIEPNLVANIILTTSSF